MVHDADESYCCENQRTLHEAKVGAPSSCCCYCCRAPLLLLALASTALQPIPTCANTHLHHIAGVHHAPAQAAAEVGCQLPASTVQASSKDKRATAAKHYCNYRDAV